MLIIVCRIIVSILLRFSKNNKAKIVKKAILIKFGNKVKEIRLKQNISQEKLAEKANVHRTYIGMIERAERNITLVNIEKIANALGIQIADLFIE